ncbi:MAG: arylsulfatase A-like enzyme [Myxococcota bacterium]|jgi:arylsulfatase A-like enzyme
MAQRLRTVIQILPLALLVSTLGCPDSSKPTREVKWLEANHPQLVLVISLDTLRADHLGVYGYGRPTSPALDAFAEHAVIFEDASTTSPWTLPSHASIMTGMYPLEHGVVDQGTKMPQQVRTLAQRLGAVGYQRYAVVNSPWLKQGIFGFMRGFNIFQFVQGGGSRVAPNTLVTDQVLHWLRQESPQPKFIFAHYIDIHSDYVSLPEHERLFSGPYEGDIDGTTEQLLQLRISDELVEGCKRDFVPERCLDASGNSLANAIRTSQLDAAAVQHLKDRYDGGIHQTDAELGRIFSYLEESGRLEDAVIVVTADHGEEFMEHGSVFHMGTQYQEVIRVPLLIRGPGIPKGLRIHTPVSLVDIAPTLLHLAGARPMLGINGLDLAPLWQQVANRGSNADAHRGSDSPPSALDAANDFTDRPIFAEAPGAQGEWRDEEQFNAVRRGRFKLHQSIGGGRVELYDLSKDPDETENIATHQPAELEALRVLLDHRHGNDVHPKGESAELGEEDREALRALGYLE